MFSKSNGCTVFRYEHHCSPEFLGGRCARRCDVRRVARHSSRAPHRGAVEVAWPSVELDDEMSTGPDPDPDSGDQPMPGGERFQHEGPQDVRRFLHTAFTPGWQLEKSSIGLSMTVRRQPAGAVVIDEFEVDGTLRCGIRTAHSVFVIQPRSGSLTVAGNAVAGAPSVVVPADTVACPLEADSAQFHVVAIDANLLLKVAYEANLLGPPRITFTSSAPSSPALASVWQRTLNYVIACLDDTDPGTPPLMVHAATRMLAAATLECFPSNIAEQPAAGLSEASQTFRNAVAFMHEYAGDDIGVNDIAAATHLTARAVQYVFRQEADMTPTEYLRRIRLDRARQDLIDGDPSLTTVAAVARKWGFGHVGRFAAQYRETYGEAPRTTLAT